MPKCLFQKSAFRILLAALLGAFAITALSAERRLLDPIPLMVIGPPNSVAFRDLFTRPEQWTRARSMTGALLYADHNLQAFTDSELKSWFAAMRGWGIPLELEVGAIKPWGATAAETYRAERPIWERVIALGGDLRSIAMDEPLGATRESLHLSDDYSLEQTALFIQMVRRDFPSVRIGDIEPYPSISASNHIAWLSKLQARLAANHVRKMDFYRLDVDWISFSQPGRGNWPEVASIANRIRRAKVPFSLIYWASGYPSEKAQGMANANTWQTEIMSEGHAFASAGGHADQVVIESWIDTPERCVPELDKTTFTGSVLLFGRAFLTKLRP